MYTAYYYDPNMDQGFCGDTNELWIGNKYIHEITSVRTSENLADLMPRTKHELVVFISSDISENFVRNINPNPEPICSSYASDY